MKVLALPYPTLLLFTYNGSG